MTEIELRFLLVVVLFTQLLVENAVLLLAQPRTSNAIAASLAIETEGKIIGVPAVLTVEAAIELTAVHTLVAVFAFTDDKRIDAVIRIVWRSVVALFRVHGAKNQITVFHMSDVVAVIRILGIPDRKTELRNIALQFRVLLEEGA